ncbi:hypothetical protein HZA99_04740, partial [Candidatus Woesearchaeota archaeon]|nr:hypothetical protein [Candidatus Woesearchaeota archaeon]
MSLEIILRSFGISSEDACVLATNNYFHYKTKTREELEAMFQKITGIYGITLDDVIAAVLKFPQFAGYDHARVVREATAVYENEAGVKAAVLKYPPFASFDHARVVREATAVYEN